MEKAGGQSRSLARADVGSDGIALDRRSEAAAFLAPFNIDEMGTLMATHEQSSDGQARSPAPSWLAIACAGPTCARCTR